MAPLLGVVSLLLALGCIVLAFIGGSMLSEATLGVGVIALALVLGVLARMVQASAHQSEIYKWHLAQTKLPPADAAD